MNSSEGGAGHDSTCQVGRLPGAEMETGWRVELLGGLRVVQAGRAIQRFRSHNAAALLAYLALHRDRTQPREELIELLWPDCLPERGRMRLRKQLSCLRKLLEPAGTPAGAVLQVDRFGVQLNPAAVTTDVAEFEAKLQAAERAGTGTERLGSLTGAVERYGGELLPGFTETWVMPERRRLAVAYQHALWELPAGATAGDRARATNCAHGRMARASSSTLPTPLETESPALSRPVSLPSGRVTFLLTDIEQSMLQWEAAGSVFRDALLRTHHTLLRQAFREHGGHEFKEMGDGFMVAFAEADRALASALAAQQSLAAHAWPEVRGPLRVRMALHTADVEPEDGDYHDLQLNYAKRVVDGGHGGQILCTEETARLLSDASGQRVGLVDLGLYRLRDVSAPWRLYQVNYPGMPRGEFPALRLQRYLPSFLPARFNEFIGREREIARLCELLHPPEAEQRAVPPRSRLVTLTGAGGIGKTRLAQEVAERLRAAYKEAVWFVALDNLTDARLIADRVLETLRLPRSPALAPLEQVITALSYQPSLLLLDNFEHLVEEGALLPRDLVARVPALTVLVTSRRRLQVANEQEFPVEPLPTPTGAQRLEQLLQWESVRLFLERAKRARAGFQVTEANARAVAAVCEKLEGLPLALELAAARAGVLTPAQMLDQLSRRLDLLVSQQPGVDPRHRSMRAALDWSYQLLAPEPQQLFARLSVFRGGWTLEAAEVVCSGDAGGAESGVGDPPAGLRSDVQCPTTALAHLEQLLHSSLVRAEEWSLTHRSSSDEPADGTGRRALYSPEEAPPTTDRDDAVMYYRMPETVREYVAEQLSAEEQVRISYRHAAYHLSLAERAEAELTGGAQAEWLDRLEREIENVRTALDWAVAHAEGRGEEEPPSAGPDPGELGLRLAGALAMFWDKRYYRREDYTRLSRLVSVEGTQGRTEARAKALQVLGNLASWLGRVPEARALLEECLSIRRELGDGKNVASALAGFGKMAFSEGDYETARASLMESLSISRQLEDRPGICAALDYLGRVARTQGDLVVAGSLYEQCLAIRTQLADRLGIADCLDDLGHLAQDRGSWERARSLHEQSLAIRQELGDKQGTTYVLSSLGQLFYLQGELVTSHQYLKESLHAWQELGNTVAIGWVLNTLGLVADRQGDYLQARSLLERTLTMRRRMGDRWGVAVSCRGLASVALHQGDGAQAATLCRESLAMVSEQGNKQGMVQCLETIAAAVLEPVAASAGAKGSDVAAPIAAAAKLLGAAEGTRAVLGTPLPPVDRPDYDRSVAAARAALGEEAFAAAWAEGRALELEQAIALALEVEL